MSAIPEPTPAAEAGELPIADPPAPPSPAPVQPLADATAPTQRPPDENVQKLVIEVAALRETFEKRLAYDRAKEQAFDHLYSELEELKRNSAAEQLRPLFLDLVLLYDRVTSTAQALFEGKLFANEIFDSVHSIGEELVEILRRREVELISAPSKAFDASIQRVVGLEPVETEADGGRVKRVVRAGFRTGKRILREQEIIITKYAPKKSPE